MLIPRPKIWTPKWPGEVRRYLHLRRDASTGHLDKHDNGEDDPDHLAKGNCCCEMCDCCFSADALPDNVRFTETQCTYGNDACTEFFAGDPPDDFHLTGTFTQINDGAPITEENWEWAGENCSCWVTKSKYRYVEKQWFPWADYHDGESPCMGTVFVSDPIDISAWIYLQYDEDDDGNCAWFIGCSDAEVQSGCFAGSPVPPPGQTFGKKINMDHTYPHPHGVAPIGGWDMTGCCGDEVDDEYSPCNPVGVTGSNPAWTKEWLDANVEIINNKCCFCVDEDGTCSVAAPDYDTDTDCNDDGYHVCSESDPDHNDNCP